MSIAIQLPNSLTYGAGDTTEAEVGGRTHAIKPEMTVSFARSLHEAFENGDYWELTDKVAKGTSVGSRNPELRLFMRLQSDMREARAALAVALCTPETQEVVVQAVERLWGIMDEARAALERRAAAPIGLHPQSTMDRLLAATDFLLDMIDDVRRRMPFSPKNHVDA